LQSITAKERLEIVMRHYERASTLLTSNTVEDRGKLLGDSAVTAMLDCLLHHGQLLKCGLRSWRTKTDAAEHLHLNFLMARRHARSTSSW
jgi:DNA replication protein DnaC